MVDIEEIEEYLEIANDNSKGYLDRDKCIAHGMIASLLGPLLKELKSVRKVVEAARPACTFIVNGINVGKYKHLGNGDTAIDGEVWEKLNHALNELEGGEVTNANS